MRFEVTKAPYAVVLKNIISLQIIYTHGDADFQTYQTITLPSTSLKYLEAFIVGFKTLAGHIDHHRGNDTPLPSGVADEGEGVIEGVDIRVPLENDMYYGHSSIYYADINIDYSSIRMFDEHGDEFIITITQ